jgi:superfamily II DNA or RNA helicase
MSSADLRSLQATFIPRYEGSHTGRLMFWCMPPRGEEQARRAMSALRLLRRGKSQQRPEKADLVIPTPQRNKTEDWEIAEIWGIRLPMYETIRTLVRMDLAEAAQRKVSDSVRIWAMAAKLAVEMVAAGEMVPLIETSDKGQLVARWGMTVLSPASRERLAMLERSLPLAGHAVVMNDGQAHDTARKRKKRGNRRRRRRKSVTPMSTVWQPEALLRAFLDAAADAMCREAMPSTSKDRPRKDNRELAPWELRWRYGLTAVDPVMETAGLVEQPLAAELGRWTAPVRPRGTPGDSYAVAYHLEVPGMSAETDGARDAWFLRFMLESNEDPNCRIDAGTVWQTAAFEMMVGDKRFVQPHESLLISLGESARVFGPIGRSLHERCPRGVVLSTEEAWEFFSQAGPMLSQLGASVRVPKELRNEGQQRLKLKLQVGDMEERWNRGPSKVGMNSVVAFQWQVAVGDHQLTAEEFREIAAMKQPLVQWRGEWLAVDPAELAMMENLFHGKKDTGTMDRAAAISVALAGEFATDQGVIDVVASGNIKSLIDSLRDREASSLVEAPAGFVGELRPYQQRGLTWLAQTAESGFGACLADDMGLGKTIQIIALLLHHRAKTGGDGSPALLICPTSVLGNWEHELRRFAPGLRVVRHHGRTRAGSATELERLCKGASVVLTTYVMARMDAELLGTRTWSHLVVDEAQNIKNPVAQQAVAVRSIPADHRIALTGTPVENRLAELWSILEFANPGLLGSLGEFRRKFAVPIERFGDAKARETLKKMVGPFVLRRLKTDPNVIQDLPEKQEYKVYCTLTREQATLYQATVDMAMARITGTSGLKRRGNILALLTALKQICNHPDHYLKEREGKLSGRSGKLARLTEMLEEVIAEGDHALVFTQYREMGDLLVEHFRSQLKVAVPFLHGGVVAEKRDEMVATFQTDPDAAPILILSIKAGGTGLNLTRANHVFHFDRWWNPAVENQATDRAFRVGQTRDVQVHKMIVTGTVEEKIDEILESKRSLAESVIGEGEAWITEMSDDELSEIFSLQATAAVDDLAEAGQ